MERFDYIVVGAGSAGCVMACRLSEDPTKEVLLLEAGGRDNKLYIRAPIAFSELYQSDCDWSYETTPQEHLNGRRILWPRGKVLGGCSSINAQIYQRGHRDCYDHWAALGNRGWGFDDVLPYFKKAEHQTRGASEYHGVDGPLQVTDLRDPHPLTKLFVEAGQAAGYDVNDDFNGALQEGLGLFQVNQKGGMRHSAARAYLKPVLKRKNLHVMTHAHVTRLLCEGSRCVGLSYVHKKQEREAKASAEVILCGGAINSPQLLLLSGIGPAAQLQALDIPTVMDLPGVGQNLQDHLVVPVSYGTTHKGTFDDVQQLHRMAAAFFMYFVFKRGILTSNSAEGGGFIRLAPDAPVPELQLHFLPGFGMVEPDEKPVGNGFTISPTLAHVQSRGYLALESKDPFAPPLIEPRYLSEQADMDVLVEGIAHARRIGSAAPFDNVRKEEVFPGPSRQDTASLEAYVRRRAKTIFHPVGTCKMGHDDMAVVDDELRVRGMEGLRVVDASIMPQLINANTNAAAIMIGEKGADLVLHGR